MSERKTSVLLKHYLKKLNLPMMLRDYATVATVCQKQNEDYTAFLLRLIEREMLDREKRVAERRVNAARFTIIKTLDTFDFTAQPGLNEKYSRELMVGEYIGKKENILLVGNSGTGKTHLATALGFAGCMGLCFLMTVPLELPAGSRRYAYSGAFRSGNRGKPSTVY